MKLSLAALPLRTRPDFETSRAFCGLAQNSAHHVPVRNSSPSRLRSRATPSTPAKELCIRPRQTSPTKLQAKKVGRWPQRISLLMDKLPLDAIATHLFLIL
ncbi:hypothetical protein ACFQHW_05855 [Lapidilactobacillus achengensis]|uniref:Uncharacterized protein n=1 Tax=Lapidilactobacillus achengensis TaxID=2486000 RepID=A0ABW1UMB2_9LACO|nr:hypothetical protein [Lapidilactobacillus achengensis]